jgi:hypothetical protein
MKKSVFIISGILLIATILVLSGCSCGSSPTTTTNQPTVASQPVSSTPPAATSPIANATPSTGYVLVKSADGNVSVSAPSAWNTNDTQLYPGSVIGVANTANNEFFIITQKAKSTLKAGDTINDYLNIVKTAFGAAVTNAAWGQPSNVTIGGCKGMAVRLTGIRKSNNTDTVYFVNVLESKNYFYNVCGYTLTASENANKPDLEKIISSFKEKD